MLGRSDASKADTHNLTCARLSKTQLSRSIIGQLSLPQFTIWLNAGSSHTLQHDLELAAISLRHELLRTESIPTQLGTSQDRAAFYTASAPTGYLVELLRAWLSMAQARETDIPQVLLILDDVDGLESSKLSELSKMVAGHGIDIIYNTRDPKIADRTSYMHAANFNVPPLQQDQAQDMLCNLTKYIVQSRTVPTQALAAAQRSGVSEFLSKTAANFGFIPAALVNGSHYLNDNLASMNPYAENLYLARWNSDADRRQIMQFRRTAYQYEHSMHSSFEISLQRLWRNTNAESPALYFCCLNLLRLLSAVKIACFARVELESLRHLLGLFLREREEQKLGQIYGEQTGLRFSLHQLSEDASKCPRCATELVHVSLLIAPDGTDNLVLNQLVMACVMLRGQVVSASDPGWRDLGLDGAESLLLERTACYISENWIPCSPRPAMSIFTQNRCTNQV